MFYTKNTIRVGKVLKSDVGFTLYDILHTTCAHFILIDRLSKYAHFVALPTNCSAQTLASIYIREMYRLYGQPKIIVSDRDVLFMSTFWLELFRLQSTSLVTSTSYHPQTNGESKILNRCLQAYLRCFVSDSSNDWIHHLPWAEWSYNT